MGIFLELTSPGFNHTPDLIEYLHIWIPYRSSPLTLGRIAGPIYRSFSFFTLVQKVRTLACPLANTANMGAVLGTVRRVYFTSIWLSTPKNIGSIWLPDQPVSNVISIVACTAAHAVWTKGVNVKGIGVVFPRITVNVIMSPRILINKV
jgi:hypothetical protein